MSIDPTGASLPDPAAGAGRVDDLSSRVRVFELRSHVRASLTADFAVWARDRRPATLRDRVIARLSFDGSAAAMAAGLRGGAAVGRQLLFSCDLAEVALHLRDSGSSAGIDGQVLVLDGSDDVAACVELRADVDGVPRWADADETGSFVFEAVEPGSYRVIVTIGADEIELGPIDVGSAA